jgi:hypothetical protein
MVSGVLMTKLKIFWKSMNTWIYAFYNWYYLMFPHLYYPDCYDYKWLEKDNALLFWESLNNCEGDYE